MSDGNGRWGGGRETPKDWKQENVTAVFKKDKKKDLENYRLVSFTSPKCGWEKPSWIFEEEIVCQPGRLLQWYDLLSEEHLKLFMLIFVKLSHCITSYPHGKKIRRMGQINEQWGGLKPGWTVDSKGCDQAESTAGNLLLVIWPKGWYSGQYHLTSSLMTWTMGQSTPAAHLQMIKLEGVPDTPEGFVDIHRNINRLEKKANGNIIQFSKRICQVLPLGRNNLRHQDSLTQIRWKTSWQGRNRAFWWTPSWSWASNLLLHQ